MAKIAYQSTKLGADRLALIDKCNDIIAEDLAARLSRR